MELEKDLIFNTTFDYANGSSEKTVGGIRQIGRRGDIGVDKLFH